MDLTKNAHFDLKYGIITRLAMLSWRAVEASCTAHLVRACLSRGCLPFTAHSPSIHCPYAPPSGPVVTLSAPAKINLGLRILRKRTDGFHDLETVFLRIGWSDTITITPAEHTIMTCSDPALPVDGSNLCLRAVGAIERILDPPASSGLCVHLQKNLPYGAGLGGGSSDAAACLMAADHMLGAGQSAETLQELAASLGSDVPFFLLEGGVALGTGRGEILRPMPFPDALRDTWLVVVAPPIHVSTAQAFAGITPDASDQGTLSTLVGQGTLADWRAGLVNDFERPLFAVHPRLARIKAALLAKGAAYAAMSGSGSALFGVFATEEQAHGAAQAMEGDVRTWVGPSDAGVGR